MRYLLHRIAIALMVLGFSLVPGVVVLHFWGPIAAAVTAAAGPALLLLRLMRRARSEQVSLKTLLTSPCAMGWQLHPALTIVAGAIFLAGGLWIVAAIPDVPIPDAPVLNDHRMTPLERHWFGTIFVLLGIGISLAGVAPLLATRGQPEADETRR